MRLLEQTVMIESEEDEMHDDDRRRGLSVSIPGLRRVPDWYRPPSQRARRDDHGEEEEECGTEEECEEGFFLAEMIAISIALCSIGVCVMACAASDHSQDRLQQITSAHCALYTMVGLTFLGIVETIALLADHLIHEVWSPLFPLVRPRSNPRFQFPNTIPH